MEMISGSCLCGDISYKAEADVKMVINCHCTDCQKATGSVHATMLFIEEDKLKTAGSPAKFDHPADSGNTLTKVFCSSCGSQLFGKNSGRAGMVGIRAGTVDQKDIIKPGLNIFCESAVPSTPMDASTKHFPKMPG